MTLWNDLTPEQQEDTIMRLQEHRKRLSLAARGYKPVTKKKKTRTAKKMKFKNPELESLFNSMPEDMKKFIKS